MVKINLDAFHGTDLKFTGRILSNNFTESTGDYHWLGDGVYFFIQGNIPPTPDINAEKWAIAQAWDNSKKLNKYDEYAIVSTKIKVSEETFLDLTTFDGMSVYCYLRDRYIDKIVTSKKRLKSGGFKDGHILNDARLNKILKIDVVKGDFYVKFADERKNNIEFRIPNITMAAVFNVVDCLDLDEIKIHKTGKIL